MIRNPNLSTRCTRILCHCVKAVLKPLFFILVIIALLFVWVIWTHTGTVFGFTLLRASLPHRLKIGTIQGRLSEGLALKKVRYSTEAGDITIALAKIQWSPITSLQRGGVYIERIFLQDVRLHHHCKSARIRSHGSTKNTLSSEVSHLHVPHLPLFLHIKSVHVQKFSWSNAKRTVVRFKTLDGQASMEKDTFHIALQGAFVEPCVCSTTLSAAGKYTHYQWHFSVRNTHSHWHVHGIGDLQHVQLLESGGALFGGDLSLTGQLHWGPGWRWDLNAYAKSLNLRDIYSKAPAQFTANVHSVANAQKGLFVLTCSHVQGRFGTQDFHADMRFVMEPVIPNTQPQGPTQRCRPHASLRDFFMTRSVVTRPYVLTLNIRTQKGTAQIRGSVRDKWALSYKVDISEVHTFFSHLFGTLHAQGTLYGARLYPQWSGVLSVAELRRHSDTTHTFTGTFRTTGALDARASQPIVTLALHLDKGDMYAQTGSSMHIPLQGILTSRLVWGDYGTLNARLQLSNQSFLATSLRVSQKMHKAGTRHKRSWFMKWPFHAHVQKEARMPEISAVAFGPLEGRLYGTLDAAELARLLGIWKVTASGLMTTDWTVRGTLDKPKMTGKAELRLTNLTLPRPGLTFREVHLMAKGDTNALVYSGTARTGSSMLTVQGRSVWRDARMRSELFLRGTNFLLMHSPGFRLWVSPNLHMTQDPKQLAIQGSIDIPRAEIYKFQKTHSVTLPQEAVIVGRDSPKQVTHYKLPISMQVRVRVGNKVHVRVHGLDTFVVGEVSLEQHATKNHEIWANGQLRLVNGRYAFQGHTLRLSNSALVFHHSPVTNPSLYIQATKSISRVGASNRLPSTTQQETVVAGMRLTGTIKEPKVTLFAEPGAWSQTDALALILFGQPADRIAEGDNAALLARAAQAIIPSLSGVGSVMHSIQHTLGLSDIGIVSGLRDEGQGYERTTALRLGKHLSPRLYVGYSVNILRAVNTLLVRYSFNKHWFLETESNQEGSGVDIYYRRRP